MNVARKRLNLRALSLIFKRRWMPIALTLGTGISLSVAAAAMVWNWENQRVRSEFQQQASRLSSILQQNINYNLEFLHSIHDFYMASTDVTRQDFNQFVQPALARHPALHSVNWIQLVPAAEKAAYEQKIRAEGFPNFKIYERDANNKPVSVTARSEYFPITYREAIEADTRSLGFDIAANPERSAALKKSIATRQMAASGRIKLITNDRPGLQVFLPLTNKDEPENLRGVIAGLFQIRNIVDLSLKSMNLNNINFYLYDNSATGNKRFLISYNSQTKQLIDSAKLTIPEPVNPPGNLCENPAVCTRLFQVADREWMLQILPAPAYTSWVIHQGSLGILAIGLLATGSLVVYLLMSLENTAKIEQQVCDRTFQLKERTAELENALQELKQAQFQLIQTEKMSSLGQLVAGIAHEINNPINFIYGNLKYVGDYTHNLLEIVEIHQREYHNLTGEMQAKLEEIEWEFIKEDLPKILASMKVGADRIREIVLSLRNFSRLDEAEMKSVNIHEGIDSTLMLLQNRLKPKADYGGIQVIKEYGNLPSIECWAGELNQVFMNILSNAIDALESQLEIAVKTPDMAFSPTILIRTNFLNSTWAIMQISDNGTGMTQEVIKHLFEPFFTTKPVGKGTGLGLSVAYKIVEKHQGSIRCESVVGKGTEFSIEIPVRQKCDRSVSKISHSIGVTLK
ncbi:MAG: CHASE domain-containing protein [Oscillatoriaceae cyanobacterium Prado104]|jgi:signal transduction histidine kinase|nr:CHASE domain-containing protein [Oscillatoriaceae cyanobacterium Prado104]